MELDHFEISESSSTDLCSSPCCLRHHEANDDHVVVDVSSSAATSAPPAAVPDSPFDVLSADVLDLEVSAANLILPNTCFKPIASQTDFDLLANEDENGEAILCLDLEDWTTCEDPQISCLYDLQDLDPMAALLAFNASCTSPCNRSFDFKTPPETKYAATDGSDPASSCPSSYSSFRSSYGPSSSSSSSLSSSAQMSSPNAAPVALSAHAVNVQSPQFACSLSQQQGQGQRYHQLCPPVSPPSPSYHHLSPNSYPTSPAYFCNPSQSQAGTLSQSSLNQVHAINQSAAPASNGSESVFTGSNSSGGGGHYSTASVSVNLSMNMTMGFAPPEPPPAIQWSMSPPGYGSSNGYPVTGYPVQSYPCHSQSQQQHQQQQQSHAHVITHHHQSVQGASNESAVHASSAYNGSGGGGGGVIPGHPLPPHEFRSASEQNLPPIEKEFSNICSYRSPLSPATASFPTQACNPYQLRETSSARFHSTPSACLRSQRKCFSRSSFPEMPPGDLIPMDSAFLYTTNTRTAAPECDQDEEQLGDDDHRPGHLSHQEQVLQERRGSPSEGPPGCNLCRICGKTYARPSTLKTHLRTHSGERPYRCEHCHKSFSQAANLTAHIRTHSGEKPFRCLICERRFSQSSSVTTHMRTHSGERPYRCRMCKKAFSDSSTLTKHLRIHSGEKPYVCRLCNLRFSQSGNLNRHMRIHSPLA